MAMVLGTVSGLGQDQTDFFNAAKSGNKKVLKRLMESGRINYVDMKNEVGQTPLFFACFEGNHECVKFLLEKGANPNEATEAGETPLHAACYNGCIKSVGALIERGGDFRFHDKEVRTAKDWALLNKDAKKRQQMTEYIVKTRMFAMTHSGRDVLLEKQDSIYMRRNTDSGGSLAHLFRRLSSKGGTGGKGEHLRGSASIMSLGYGKVYGGERGGIISTIPLVAESMLQHDDYATTFGNGAYFTMEGMMMGPTKVTVKRLHHDPPKGAVVDYLIKECENIANWDAMLSNKGLKRKIEAILSKDSEHVTGKRSHITNEILLENGCSPLPQSPPSDMKPPLLPSAYSSQHQSWTSWYPPSSTYVDKTSTSGFLPSFSAFASGLPSISSSNDGHNMPRINKTTHLSGFSSKNHTCEFSHLNPEKPSTDSSKTAATYSKYIELCDLGQKEELDSDEENLVVDDYNDSKPVSSSSESVTGASSVSYCCKTCIGKDALVDLQKNLILQLQTELIAAKINSAVPPLIDPRYIRVSVRQGKIPRDIAEAHNMYEILVLGEFKSGVFLSPSFKYELEVNYNEKGTTMAKKLLHCFYSEYDLAYAAFVSSRANKYHERNTVRAAMASEINAAKKARETKGLKYFQRDRILANPNNVLPSELNQYVVANEKDIPTEEIKPGT